MSWSDKLLVWALTRLGAVGCGAGFLALVFLPLVAALLVEKFRQMQAKEQADEIRRSPDDL